MEDVSVHEVQEFDDHALDAVRRLLTQLSSTASPASEKLLREIVESDSSHLIFARTNKTVLGMLTLVVFPIPSGLRAWIEDVVVDGAGRGKGVGEALNRFALDMARQEGVRSVDLTSRASREAANRLYKRMGFIQRDTNVYRFEADST